MADPRIRWIVRETDWEDEEQAGLEYADDHEDDADLADWLDE